MNIRKIFQIFDATKKQRELITSWANKAGKDPTKIIEWVESTFKSDAEQFAAAKWVIKGYDPKVFAQALYICQQKKLDPQGQNPEELVANNADTKKKEKPINPDDVLTDKQEDGEGNVTYAARDEDRKVIRQIINTHFGVDANPWCLMQAEGGKLTRDSITYWKRYSAYPKRIAFRNGKLIAFSAGRDVKYREWWDRQDRSFPFIPYNGKTWEDKWGKCRYEIRNGHTYRTWNYNGSVGRLSEEYSENIEESEVEIKVVKANHLICFGDDTYRYTQDEKGNYVVNDDNLKCTVSPDLFLEGEYQKFYKRGHLEEKCFYKNGKLDGEFQKFYLNGQLYTKSFFKNGEPEGEYQAFYNNGQLKTKCFYKNGNKEGEYRKFYDDGQPYVKSFYKNGKLEGEYQKFYKRGHLEEKCFYKNGKLDGEFQKFYLNGQLYWKCFYKNGNQEGEYQSFYESGQLDTKCSFKNGKWEGEYQTFFDNGQLSEKCFYKDDKKEGEFQKFCKNGQPNIKCSYKNGKLNGEYRGFYFDGQPNIECFYKNGKLDGEYQEFYGHGQLKLKCSYKNDKLEGEYQKFHPNGQLQERSFYKNDKRVD